MGRIFYRASNYKGMYSHLNTNDEQHLICNKIDLYRAIISVGSPSFISWRAIRENGLFRVLSTSILQKWALVHDNIESIENNLILHPIFLQQVSDQKRIISYNLGMAFAKIYAERLLEIPNLIHVETLKKLDAITFHNTGGKKREPDLVGQTTDGLWHVFEAKGVSRNQLNTKIIEAKSQANEVDTIHGNPPATSSACATYLGSAKILSRIEDPDEKREKKIEIKTNEYYQMYYNSFFSLKEFVGEDPKKNKFEEMTYYEFRILTKKLNLTVGLDEEVYELIQEKNYQPILNFLQKKKGITQETVLKDTESISLGSDGFIVRYTDAKNSVA